MRVFLVCLALAVLSAAVAVSAAPDFQYHGYRVYRTKVKGQINSRNIRAACRARKMRPVTDHPSYKDNYGVVLRHRGLHWSHPSHNQGATGDADVQRTVWYCGHANHGRALQTVGRSHRWTNNNDRNLYTWCALPPRRKTSTKTTVRYYGLEFVKLSVKGRMTSRNILKTCKSKGLLTICDHASYADGNCKQLLGKRHMSHNSHNYGFPRSVIDRTYWYAGSANHGRSLQNWRNSHRWSSIGDKDGYILCAKKPKVSRKPVATYRGWKWYHAIVPGRVNSWNIRRACKKLGAKPLCDHQAYADGYCVTLIKRSKHWSHRSHNSMDRHVMRRVYFYAGRSNNGKALQYFRGSHRWTSLGDIWGVTMCAKPPPQGNWKRRVASYRGYKFYKVRIEGQVTSRAILRACRSKKLLTPCDHVNYGDGKCIALNGAKHMSYNRHHNFPRDVIDRTYWYCGTSNNGKALQNWRNTHRWSKKGDMYGFTLCMKPLPLRRRPIIRLRGWRLYQARIRGLVNSANIRRACRRRRMIPICDHPNYADGRCAAVKKAARHFSYDRHHSHNRGALEGMYFYCGRANHGRALQNWHNTHRWTKTGDKGGVTLCGVPPRRRFYKRVSVRNWRGWDFWKVRIRGQVNSDSIRRACRKYKMQIPCGHSSYNDGQCVNVINGRHMSYPPHTNFPRGKNDRIYWYCGRANGGKSLQKYHNTHRWSKTGDQWGYTMCVRRSSRRNRRRQFAIFRRSKQFDRKWGRGRGRRGRRWRRRGRWGRRGGRRWRRRWGRRGRRTRWGIAHFHLRSEKSYDRITKRDLRRRLPSIRRLNRINLKKIVLPS